MIVDILKEITNVLDIEIEGLQAARDGISPSWAEAVGLIANSAGQVFVTGVGKSGIVAQKIAATFRSTGTPAVFIHGGDGLHGDVGMVRDGDVVIAIGKSGETAELNALLRAIRGNGGRVISLTSSPDSSMAQLSDLVLNLPDSREACPLNLAPTTSTTVALAVGDGLAVALMKLKRISEEDFARHHPGGQLGRRLLLKVSDVMRKGAGNPVIPLGSTVREMLARITAFQVGAVSVVGGTGELEGLVTDFDIRRILESNRNILEMTIPELMNAAPETILEDERAVTALERMRRRDKPIAVLPVVDRNRCPVGMIHLHDLISAGL
jgi:arabinose-5-phosphate isomerase